MDIDLSETGTSHAAADPRLAALRHQVRDLCLAPGNRMGADFFREHVELVEYFALCVAPIFQADLAVVLPAAILHDIAAIEDFSQVAEHHLRGARRAAGTLADFGFPSGTVQAASRCIELHLVPVDPGAHGPEAACLSHADALAQMANPAFWLHYAGKVRGLDFAQGRDWYRALLDDRFSRMTDSVKPIATPFFERARGACRDAYEHLRSPAFEQAMLEHRD